MSLREDVKCMLKKDWKPNVPNNDEILKQAKMQIRKGKSTGNVALDMKAIEVLKHDEKER